jgi:hypothetical protein
VPVGYKATHSARLVDTHDLCKDFNTRCVVGVSTENIYHLVMINIDCGVPEKETWLPTFADLALSPFSSGLFRAMFAMNEISNGNEIHRRVSA